METFSSDRTEQIEMDSFVLGTEEVKQQEELPPPGPTRLQIWLKRIGYIFFGLVCLLGFTFIKLPNDPIRSYVDGSISSFVAQKGITLQSRESAISFLIGFTYTMKDVTLSFPPPFPPSKIEEISISPSLFPLLLGKKSLAFQITSGKGKLSGHLSLGKKETSLDFNANQIDLGKLGLVPISTGIQGSAILDGTGNLSGDLNVPNTIDGKSDIKFHKLSLDPQVIMGFSVPKINISEGTFQTHFSKGQGKIDLIQLGPSKGQSVGDDLQAKITGNLVLGQNWSSSTMDLKTHFSFSPNVLKSFVLIDALLGAGKLPDGSYSFHLTGPLFSPSPAPLPAGG